MSDNQSASDNQSSKPTPKQQLHNLMVEMFGLIEDMNIEEGKYLQFAGMFKEMNINIDRLAGIKSELVTNVYYQTHIRQTTVRRKRLTEEEKRRCPKYTCCNCGRYICKIVMGEHLRTQVHFQGRRMRKYAGKGMSDALIKSHIEREVALQAFIIKHLKNVGTISNVDDMCDDEI